MLGTSTLADMTAPYSALEAWLYDAVVGPAVAGLGEALMIGMLGAAEHGASVLDVGCGGGHNALNLARRRPDLQITGLDLSPEQVTRATRRAGPSRAARFVEGSALDLPFADGAFDVVYSVASIKHWPDPGRGLRECVRVLKPGGTLVIVEADRGCSHDDAVAFVRTWHLPAPLRPLALAFFRTWVAGRSLDLDDARALASQAGLAAVDVRRLERTPALVLRGTR